MTDKDTIIKMLQKANINLTIENKLVIDIERGFVGFHVLITFDEHGNLKDIGAYEE